MRRLIVGLSCLLAVSVGLVGATAEALAGSGPVSSAQVATPIRVQTGKVVSNCGPSGKHCGWAELLVTISFTSRVTISTGSSWYEFNSQFTPDGPCSHGHNVGLGGRIVGDVSAGLATHLTFGISDCPGVVHGDVVYDSATGPHTKQDVPGVGYIDGLLVGTFSFHMH
jgi:hypothetical protein